MPRVHFDKLSANGGARGPERTPFGLSLSKPGGARGPERTPFGLSLSKPRAEPIDR